MTPIEQRFVEVIGKILGRRWFDMQQASRDVDSNAQLHILPCEDLKTTYSTVKNKPKRRYNNM